MNVKRDMTTHTWGTLSIRRC